MCFFASAIADFIELTGIGRAVGSAGFGDRAEAAAAKLKPFEGITDPAAGARHCGEPGRQEASGCRKIERVKAAAIEEVEAPVNPLPVLQPSRLPR